MDDWTMYQITGEERYITAHRRKGALRAGLMGGSLGAISVVCTSMMASQMSQGQDVWPPRWLPKRAAGVAVLAFSVTAWISWRNSSHMVGQFMIAQPNSAPSTAPEPEAAAATISSGTGSKTI
eukprot:TRINITY_DN44677_c0_g1_i1.p1 TRINITY_DN44677_c0_g1~~TRINITY_DN44677_c0_g1_i1.p1  ORF type:complete len:123 (+),score=15.84 TRINITY_DN44677_c0_g1_i1:70-438(+)